MTGRPQLLALVIPFVWMTGCDPGGPVLAQDGLGGELTLHREALDVSVSDVEAVYGGLFLAPQTEDCALGASEEQGIAIAFDPSSTGVRLFIVEDPALRTREGIGVGSSTEEILAAFGPEDVAVLDDVPSQTDGPLVVVADLENPDASPGPSSLHYGFDTDGDGLVTRVRAGFWPYVAYTDYCSPEAPEGPTSGWPLTRSVP